MDIIEAIQRRKSIRSFKPDPVPREILQKIIDIARRSPSSLNTQPWEATVVAGAVLENIKRYNLEKLASGATPNTEITSPAYEGVYRQRQVELAVQIFQLMGITREDKEKRAEWNQRGFRFFDAPSAIIISIDKSLAQTWPIFDVGVFSQTIMLAAFEYGLGTCVHNQGVMFPDVVRKYAGIPDSKRIVNCISIGYPDWDFPANKLETKRESPDTFTTWLGFD